MKDLKLFYENCSYKIFEYSPHLFKFFLINIEPLTFKRIIRFFFEYIKGYKVYYLSIEDAFVGYCVISCGGGRYSFADKSDIVVGPYFIEPKSRGKGYSELLVSSIIDSPEYANRTAFDWIKKDNIPSLKCSKKLGFHVVREAKLGRFFRTIKIVNNGDYYILKRACKNEDINF